MRFYADLFLIRGLPVKTGMIYHKSSDLAFGPAQSQGINRNNAFEGVLATCGGNALVKDTDLCLRPGRVGSFIWDRGLLAVLAQCAGKLLSPPNKQVEAGVISCLTLDLAVRLILTGSVHIYYNKGINQTNVQKGKFSSNDRISPIDSLNDFQTICV